MGQALYRKYRSKSFAEVVGQEHITKTLLNAIGSGRISHAYLFTGPRGVGKTSVARILAHEVNGFDYSGDSVHLDIIEIDAASNRRIDEIRDLRDKVNIAPAEGKYKVYIIDEVHMLTREAFNALLKTLEEPPAHCIFILATTEAHKLPETIISRTQRFEFAPVTKAQAAAHLGSIAKAEKIDIDTEALELLAEFGNGSFRDSISYLDQLSAYSKGITAEDVRSLLGLPPAKHIDKLAGHLAAADMSAVMETLKSMEISGVKPAAIAASLSDDFRHRAASGQAETWQVQLLSPLLAVSTAQRPQDALEIALLESVTARAGHLNIDAPAPKPDKKIAKLEIPSQEAPANKTKAQKPAHSGFDLSLWSHVLDDCKQQAASIYTALRLAQPSYEDGKLSLGFQFPLHQKKLGQAKNQDLVVDIIERICGEKVRLEAILLQKQPSVKSEPEPVAVSNIADIFGGAEVVEA
jgi:DNA polymerase-3 subunit gamma/tau